jgi:hypothetical protein
MALVPYCIFLTAEVEVPPTGIQGSLVSLLTEDELSVTYSEIAEPQQLSGDRLQGAALDFHNTVHAIFAHRAVIPFRFPTLLSERELREHLRSQAVPYRNFLGEHANEVQMEVRLWPFNSARPQPGTSGTEYMLGLAADEARILCLSEIPRGLPGVREWRTRRSRDLVRLFALVDRKHLEEFRTKAKERFPAGNIRMRVSGPWPATEFLPVSEHSAAAPPKVSSITRGEKP